LKNAWTATGNGEQLVEKRDGRFLSFIEMQVEREAMEKNKVALEVKMVANEKMGAATNAKREWWTHSS
jgi:hypothetical protein